MHSPGLRHWWSEGIHRCQTAWERAAREVSQSPVFTYAASQALSPVHVRSSHIIVYDPLSHSLDELTHLVPHFRDLYVYVVKPVSVPLT